ncbi:hypothetical protein HNY73_016126 [Argiope bruennichi]|uniref:Uncharacterized protein n=1 Tax=Argiope bruennichi TaxID=94029 RepID=A0A8T0ELQ8_ARGBR|nr:hypothetical protein HNY73_016126 [Argiope bruennichi]
MENPGMELISKLMNDINANIISIIGQDFKSSKKNEEGIFRHCAQRAVIRLYPGNLQKNALSEAHKQLALLQSGCMIYGADDERIAQQLKRRQESEASERAKSEKIEKKANSFKVGIKKTFSNLLPTLSLDIRAAHLLGHRIYTFAKIVVDRVSQTYEKKDELLPAEIKNIVTLYLQGDALRSANSEGNKCLVMYENGLLDFKPRRTIKSGWTEESAAWDLIFASVFKNGIKRLLNDRNADVGLDSKAPKYLGHILMDLANYLAETTADACKKKKLTEIGHEDLRRTVTALFPEQLRQHALLQGTDDVSQYIEGLLLYDRESDEPKKTKKPKRKVILKSRKVAFVELKKGKQTKASKGRPIPKRPARKTERKKPPRAPAPTKSIFAPALIESIPQVFNNAQIVLARDAANNVGAVLENVFEALMQIVLSQRTTESEELSEKQITEAVIEIFPKQLAEHSIATGNNKLLTMAKGKSD